MAKTALIIGGTGQIGRATSGRLASEGWRLTIAQRHDAPPPPGGVRLTRSDRFSEVIINSPGHGLTHTLDLG